MKQLLILCVGISCFSRSVAQELYKLPFGQHSAMSSMENLNGVKGHGGLANDGAKGSPSTNLKAGDSLVLMADHGAGVVQRIWVTINDRSAAMLRGLRLRMYWDGSPEPAVDVPFGDFFCNAFGHDIPFESALFASPEGHSFNCYIGMPYRSAARIVLTNESRTALGSVFFDVDFLRLDKPDTEALYFHASWRRQRDTVPGKDVELLPKVAGSGRFLGVSIGVGVNPVYGRSWWGEGEVKMYIDGDSAHPSINGTGSEDYIGTGWGESHFIGRYQGCLLSSDSAHEYAFYRFHIPDAVVFDRDIKVTIQQIGGWDAKGVRRLLASHAPLLPVTAAGADGFTKLWHKPDADAILQSVPDRDWVNFYRVDDYAVTAYYYLNRP